MVMKKVWVFSSDSVQETAVKTAIAELGLDLTVYGFKGGWGETKQLFGYDQIYRCGFFHVFDAWQNTDDSEIVAMIGIASGIISQGDQYYEISGLQMMGAKRGTLAGWTKPVNLEKQDVLITYRLGFDRVSLGEVLAEKYQCDKNEYYSFLTDGKHTRGELLKKAAEKMFLSGKNQSWY
jgi:non-canonical (house-cleaning) NTP pyrophosphatase